MTGLGLSDLKLLMLMVSWDVTLAAKFLDGSMFTCDDIVTDWLVDS